MGNVEASRTGVYGYDIRMEVVGTQGAVFVGGPECGRLMTATAEGARRPAFSGFESRFADSYKAELEEFAECISEGRAPECGVREGVTSLEVALAAAESLRKGEPVDVHYDLEF